MSDRLHLNIDEIQETLHFNGSSAHLGWTASNISFRPQ